MPIVDHDNALKYMSSLGFKSEREDIFQKYLALPYQVVSDSPTIKHYTEWSIFEGLNLNVNQNPLGNVKVPLEGYTTFVFDNNIPLDFQPSDSVKCGLVKPEDHKLVALTLSLARKISLNKGGKYLVFNSCKGNNFCPVSIDVTVPEGESMEVIYYSDASEVAMPSSAISLDVPKGSSLSFSIVNSSRNSFGFVYAKARVEGEINSSIFSVGQSLGHTEYHVNLEEEALANFNAKALGIGDNKVNILANVNHRGKKSVSNGVLKAVASGSSFTVIRGDAVIEESALDSSTTILGKALIIGDDSKAVVAPMLEVKTGKIVTAKHSASASKVSEDLIFYLENRGLDKRSAEGLIIRGFLSDDNDNQIIRTLVEDAISKMGY
ncbi:SufD family Fe-S cluster assembly protein [Metallosphaera tengchongensis]|uniref:SufD family Fe-S cluster assembly protein n=1 Tax=Metallosphaera tengchongensis TaxID=1532350 RepID=A0A6N0NU63_9CREN|nr:SufD family Fe-S cluster assembly protein [Metallosphaera tengchongensis]QKQ99308.1 SufD family Fe-S cluster assembly protein [Metallosphaera tengchongensis]